LNGGLTRLLLFSSLLSNVSTQFDVIKMGPQLLSLPLAPKIPKTALVSCYIPCWCEELGFGVMGMELRSVDSDSAGLCLVDSENMW
jgi:hypothetical protein